MYQAYPTPTKRRGLKAMLAILLINAGLALADPNAEELIAAVGIPPGAVRGLQKGEIVSFSVSEPTGKSLASGIAMYVKAPPEKVADLVRRGSLLASDPDVIARGDLPSGAGAEGFGRFTYAAAQADEAKALLEAKAGTHFNLSSQEIASFSALRGGLDTGNVKALTEAVSFHYRKLLAERVEAYRAGGLSGIAVYDRGNGAKADPGAALSTDIHESKVLAQYFPKLYQTLLGFPAELPAGTESLFFWVNRKIEKRPTAVLVHRLSHALTDGAVMVQREFYVGHSYNSSQAVACTVPYQDGALVLYRLRSSTDQVAGMGQALKHSIGRDQLIKEIAKKFERLKSKLKG